MATDVAVPGLPLFLASAVYVGVLRALAVYFNKNEVRWLLDDDTHR